MQSKSTRLCGVSFHHAGTPWNNYPWDLSTFSCTLLSSSRKFFLEVAVYRPFRNSAFAPAEFRNGQMVLIAPYLHRRGCGRWRFPGCWLYATCFSRQYSEFLTSHENFVTVDTDYFMGKMFLDPSLLCGLLLTKFNVSVLLFLYCSFVEGAVGSHE